MFYFAKFSQAKYFAIILFSVISQQMFSVGFSPDTKVWVKNDGDQALEFVEIGDLKIGNNCLSLNLEAGKIETTEIIDIVSTKEQVTKLTLAVLTNNFNSETNSFIKFIEVEVSSEHQFFVPTIQEAKLRESWKLAKELKPGNVLVKIPGGGQLEDFIAIVVKTEVLEEEKKLICLSLKTNHNFFVSELGIIAHNIAPILGITYIFGSGFAQITASQIINGLCFLVCAAGMAKHKFDTDSETVERLKRFDEEKRRKQETERLEKDSYSQKNSTTGWGVGGGNGGGKKPENDDHGKMHPGRLCDPSGDCVKRQQLEAIEKTKIQEDQASIQAERNQLEINSLNQSVIDKAKNAAFIGACGKLGIDLYDFLKSIPARLENSSTTPNTEIKKE